MSAAEDSDQGIEEAKPGCGALSGTRWVAVFCLSCIIRRVFFMNRVVSEARVCVLLKNSE